MANAGVPPEGWSSSEVQRLRYAHDATTSFAPIDQASLGRYAPKYEEDYRDRTRTFTDAAGITYEEDYAAPEAPARLTDLPTSSTNVNKPRTVAAGYDAKRQVMTVVFRDGTVYNYYDVTTDQWIGFHNSISKGRPWLNKFGPNTPGEFIHHRQGPADMSNVDPRDAQEIYAVVATAQTRYKTKRFYKTQSGGKTIVAQRVLKNAHSLSKLSPNSQVSKGYGVNPAKNKGKNPK